MADKIKDNGFIEHLNETVDGIEKHGRIASRVEMTTGDFIAAVDLINRQKAENAELLSELTITKNNFDNAKERYDEAVKIGQKINDKLVAAYKKLQTAKSEAIKEFWDKLKTMKFRHKNFGELVYVDDGNNLIKEMEGELANETVCLSGQKK